MMERLKELASCFAIVIAAAAGHTMTIAVEDPPNSDGLIHWMTEMVDHASILQQSRLVRDVFIPNIHLFGPPVYADEVLIGVSLIMVCSPGSGRRLDWGWL